MKKLFYALLVVCGLLSVVSCEEVLDTDIVSGVKLGRVGGYSIRPVMN